MGSIRKAFQDICFEISLIYEKQESESIAYILLDQFGVMRIDVSTQPDMQLAKVQEDLLHRQINRLKMSEPIQYIIGTTEFYDLLFKVSPAVLIPRRETEELIHWIASLNKYKHLRILDIGTGSGCIAISLAVHIPKAEIHAIDVSPDALKVAKENAVMNKAKVNFFESNILRWKEFTAEDKSCGACYEKDLKYDIIVSNPPYVRNCEKSLMHKNVLDFEPSLALFVEDSNPLLFYKTIVDFSNEYLNFGGMLYFEINEIFGNDIVAYMAANNFTNIILKQDMQGKDRMICGTKIG